jgi:hypothetical protein
VLREGAGIRAIAPLRIEVTTYLGRPRRLLQFIGEPSEVDRPTILRRGEDREAVNAIFRYLVEHHDVWDTMLLYEQPTGGLVLDVAKEHFKARSDLVGIVPGPRCPWVDLSGSWSVFVSAKSRSFRKGLRQKLARLKRRGEVEFRTIDAIAELGKAFEHYLEVEGRSWKPAKRLGAARSEAYLSYHRALVDEFGPSGKLVIRILYIDKKPIAATFGLIDRGRFFSLHIAHDQEYDAFSPGTLLTAYELEESYARQDLDEYDFLGGFLENKTTWTSNMRDTEQFYVYRRELLLRLHYVWHFRAEPMIKRLLKRVGLLDLVVRTRNALRSLVGRPEGQFND